MQRDTGVRERLAHCVHCGFCLPVCPTYRRLGDEADSPRGRLHFMRAVVEGRLSPASDAFQRHIDRCLGCRACEPVCPSGVEYGALLEVAREAAARHRPPGWMTRALLWTFRRTVSRRAFLLGGRVIRDTGMAALAARWLPGRAEGRTRMAMAMLVGSRAWRGLRGAGHAQGGVGAPAASGSAAAVGVAPEPATLRDDGARHVRQPVAGAVTVALLDGCVQAGLFGRVNRATRRVLEANGYTVVKAPGQSCCGALHAHGGALGDARALARANIEAFEAAGVDRIAINAAGCGAAMKEYGELLRTDPAYAARAERLAGRVRDVTELLVEAGPRTGAPLPLEVAYDAPCHLLHAQGVAREPLDVLAAIPGLRVREVRNAEECCGGAGIYGLTHPELGGTIGADKVEAVRETGAAAVATGNPGCMMQIGARLRLSGDRTGVVHPVELLDESYRRAGFYGRG